MPVGLLRADNNLPPWRPGLKEVLVKFLIQAMHNTSDFSLCFSVRFLS